MMRLKVQPPGPGQKYAAAPARTPRATPARPESQRRVRGVMTVYPSQEPCPAASELRFLAVRARRIGSPASCAPTRCPAHVVHAFRLAAPADLDEQFTAWLAEAHQAGELPCHPERTAPANSPEPPGFRATPPAYHGA